MKRSKVKIKWNKKALKDFEQEAVVAQLKGDGVTAECPICGAPIVAKSPSITCPECGTEVIPIAAR